MSCLADSFVGREEGILQYFFLAWTPERNGL
jgi:hypothetical protein